MKHVELGRTGEKVSQIGLGCMLMGTTTDEATSVAVLDRFTEAGGTFLDTANCYAWWSRPDSDGGESESLLGRWLAAGKQRDRVFLATKATALPLNADEARLADGSADWDRVRFDGAGAKTLHTSIDDSLRRLGTDHVDLYYVHVDDRATPLEETLEALAEIVRAGKARYIGWSNVRTWRVERVRGLCERHGWPAPVALQQQHSYLRPRTGLDAAGVVDTDQLDYLRAHDDLALVAYSPILRGIYDDEAKRRGHWMMERYAGPDAEARLAALAEVAAEVGATPNQVVLAWLLHQTSPRTVPLVGPRTLEQYEAALPALSVTLSADQLARLDTAGV
ncbi:aldo/keto reductase [Streptomyces sp. p1417]|uniref:Aldo/keto reductase n=1 Tax=Streptomyces typhae TaxID=2681492 RepID=A0A6L6WTP9_9ACTN|nr:aldo/keto reductase [Streptomyces typhae]MVO85662.1 aldo/keto reductase [Streptomyces typhae]